MNTKLRHAVLVFMFYVLLYCIFFSPILFSGRILAISDSLALYLPSFLSPVSLWEPDLQGRFSCSCRFTKCNLVSDCQAVCTVWILECFCNQCLCPPELLFLCLHLFLNKVMGRCGRFRNCRWNVRFLYGSPLSHNHLAWNGLDSSGSSFN